jgi:hypothetical protein
MEHNFNIDDVISEEANSQVTVSGGEVKERSCDSLVMCIVTTLNQGLRNGGGIGDILRAPSSTVSHYYKIMSIKIELKLKILLLFYRKSFQMLCVHFCRSLFFFVSNHVCILENARKTVLDSKLSPHIPLAH